MAYEFLKKLFGTDESGNPKAMTYEELETAIEADKKLKLADLSAGGYIAKEKLDSKITELEGVRQQLASANAQIQSYKDMDVDGIKKSVDDWKMKYDADTKKLQDQITAQERSYAENMFLSAYQFTSKAARKGVLDEIREKNFRIENGQLQGAKDFMTELMGNEDYKGAFKAESSGGDGSKKDGSGGADPDKASQSTGGAHSTTGNIYTGPQPRFSAATNGGAISGGNTSKFNFGFTHVNEKKS